MSSETDTGSATAQQPSVLVVDDEPGLADLYTAWLKDRYDTQTAYSGEEALELLDETIEVVLLDRRMPGCPGDEVLEAIREKHPTCRVAMVTAVRPDFDLLELKFDDYLSKPASQDDLVEVIEGLLERRQYHDSINELYRLLTIRTSLEAEKSRDTLEASEEYQALLEEIEQVRDRADERLASLLKEQPENLLHDLLGREDSAGG